MSLSNAVMRIAGTLRNRPRVCGSYTLERKIGEGAMGSVWRGRHEFLERPAAVKLLPADRMDAASVKRFEREVQLATRLTSPNAVTIYDFGRSKDGTYYYAMELVDGLDLEQLVDREGPISAERVTQILVDLCDALGDAHDLGLVHRDVKPSNVMLDRRRSSARLLDFGLVKRMGVDQEPGLTAVNAITGSPMYMAPEAITSPESVDARSDLYSLGVLAWFLLAGRAPFEGGLIEVCSNHLHTPPPRLGGNVPAALEEAIMACMAKRPEDRPRNTRALRAMLGN